MYAAIVLALVTMGGKDGALAPPEKITLFTFVH